MDDARSLREQRDELAGVIRVVPVGRVVPVVGGEDEEVGRG